MAYKERIIKTMKYSSRNFYSVFPVVTLQKGKITYEMDCFVFFSVTYLAGNRLCVVSHISILAVKNFITRTKPMTSRYINNTIHKKNGWILE